MATSYVSTKPKLTTCSICFETFKTPRSLPCLHTFCEECITKYILNVLSKEEAPKGQIKCPICRMTVEQPEGVDKIEWGKSLPHNHLMVSILDCESVKEGKTCDACKRRNETESATKWCVECRDSLCDKCAAGHLTYRISMGHKVINITELDESSIAAFDSLTCSKHQEKKLEAFCWDHSVACCITCVTLEHRKCENVGTIESAAEEIRKSTVLANLEKELNDIDSRLKDKTKDKAKSINEIKEACANIKDEVKSVRARIDTHLDEIQEMTLKELSAAEKEVLPKLENEKESLDGQRAIVSNCLEVLRTGLKYASHAQLLVELEKLKVRKSALNKFLTERANDGTIGISYEKSMKLDGIQKIESFGRINRTDRPLNRQSSVPIINMLQGTAKVSRTINTSHDSFFSGGFVMENDSVLIAQYSAGKLELYNQKGCLLSQLQLDGSVMSVEMIGGGKGITTVCGKQLLVFFDVVDETQLKETSRKNLEMVFYDVRHYDGKLYVACEKEIKILDFCCNELGKIAPLSSRARFFDIDYIRKTLCYTSNDYNVLTCIDLDGTQVFQYSSPDLRSAAGVSYDFAGNIYVVGNSSGNVHQLTMSGQLNKIIVQGLSQPYALRFERNSNKFIANSNGQAIIYEIM